MCSSSPATPSPRGADLLGVAGGDGTQALVAQVAAENDVPFLVISAGTRNHFALDLGLDREDPSRCLDALRDGVEARIDLGDINGRPFVNNASFGAYAEIVDEPGATATTSAAPPWRRCPTCSAAGAAPTWWPTRTGWSSTARRRSWSATTPTTTHDFAGAGRRARLDRGTLGVIAVRVDTARQAVGLLNGAHQRGLTQTQARDVLVSCRRDRPSPSASTGSPCTCPLPVRCTVRPGALRVRLPRERPGVRPPQGRLNWASLWGLAVGRHPTADVLSRTDHLAPAPPAGPDA